MNWGDIKLGWAMPNDRSDIKYSTHVSCMAMDRPDFIYLETPRSGDIAEKRDNQTQRALDLDCTHVVYLDSDMVYPPHILPDLFELLEDGADLASGLCYCGQEPFFPTVWHPTEERLMKPYSDFKFGDVVEAGATGAACLLVKREVLEGMEKPWFRMQMETVERDGTKVVIRRGEDTYFTRKAVASGFKLRVLTKYDIGHLREFMVDRQFWLTFSILNALGSWEEVVKLYRLLSNKEWRELHFGTKPSTGSQNLNKEEEKCLIP